MTTIHETEMLGLVEYLSDRLGRPFDPKIENIRWVVQNMKLPPLVLTVAVAEIREKLGYEEAVLCSLYPHQVEAMKSLMNVDKQTMRLNRFTQRFASSPEDLASTLKTPNVDRPDGRLFGTGRTSCFNSIYDFDFHVLPRPTDFQRRLSDLYPSKEYRLGNMAKFIMSFSEPETLYQAGNLENTDLEKVLPAKSMTGPLAPRRAICWLIQNMGTKKNHSVSPLAALLGMTHAYQNLAPFKCACFQKSLRVCAPCECFQRKFPADQPAWRTFGKLR